MKMVARTFGSVAVFATVLWSTWAVDALANRTPTSARNAVVVVLFYFIARR